MANNDIIYASTGERLKMMTTVETTASRLTDNRKKIYEYMVDHWVTHCYVPSLRAVARELVIPLATIGYHMKKLMEADLIYRVAETGTYVLRGATTNIDIHAFCEPEESAFNTPGGYRVRKE